MRRTTEVVTTNASRGSVAMLQRVPQHTLIAVALMAAVLAGCRSYSGPPAERAASTRSTTTTAAPTTTTTTLPPTTVATTVPVVPGVTVAPPPLPGLGKGSTGPAVQDLEQKLAALHFDVGAVDGRFDTATYHAVMAFQKVQGLGRSGRATDDVVAALAGAKPAAAGLPDGGPDRIEIDLPHQYLTLWQGGQLVRALSISTGSGRRYCVDGECAKAVTPGGSFKVTRKINGLRVSRLGQLYNPLYFNGGIAIHGSPSVPGSPASHGCVRIPMVSSKWFFDTVPVGTPVYVIGGSKAPVPFNEQAPTDDAASSTTAPTVPVTDTTTTLAPVLSLPTTLPVLGTTTTTVATTTTTVATTTTTTTTTAAPPPSSVP